MKFLISLTTFIIIILAELGDKTQVATLIYSSNHPNKRWQVFLSAAAALVACVGLEVTVGVMIARIISPALINRLTGAIFIIIGAITIRSLVKDIKATEFRIQESARADQDQIRG